MIDILLTIGLWIFYILAGLWVVVTCCGLIVLGLVCLIQAIGKKKKEGKER